MDDSFDDVLRKLRLMQDLAGTRPSLSEEAPAAVKAEHPEATRQERDDLARVWMLKETYRRETGQELEDDFPGMSQV
jgi:hypothetical protein